MSDALACLLDRLSAGPLSVQDFMVFCLSDPVHGSYMHQNPLGRDFTTAPEISQMFGELIGLAFANAWLQQQPQNTTPWLWVECGPGRGTLTADALRAAAPHLPFVPAVHCVETSPRLRDVQRETLQGWDVTWHETLDTLPTTAPLFVVANEWFDALPVQSYMFTAQGWRRRILQNHGGMLAFGVDETAPPPEVMACLAEAFPPQAFDVGCVFEYPALGLGIFHQLCDRLSHQGGQALIIDYGPQGLGLGDTLQAVYRGQIVDVLSHIGHADVSCHVPFALFQAQGRQHHPTLSFDLTSQGRFLHDLGLLHRLSTLMRRAP
ncbi:MAG: SAM-dependent methyltransferase, partial [Alphaproteobacteria bacterium]